MKKCGMKSCPVPVEQQEFNKNKAKKDGLNNICKVCSQARSKQYYQDNKDKHKGEVFKRNKRNRLVVLGKMYDYLSTKECLKCGEKDLTVLEFDHLRDKTDSVSAMISQGKGWQTIQDEIAKCQVLCANCHRRKTAIDQQWFVLEYLKNKHGSLGKVAS